MGNLSIRCCNENTPGQELCLPQRSSASMSFSWLFLGGLVSTRAHLRFTNRGQCAVNSVRRSSLLQRTANYLLTVCLTPGGKRSQRWHTLIACPDSPLFESFSKELSLSNGLSEFDRYDPALAGSYYINKLMADGAYVAERNMEYLTYHGPTDLIAATANNY
jgi:hypothetical protein